MITPDGGQPHAVTHLDDARVTWLSFSALSQAIETALADPRGVASEQARFLLRELQALLVIEGLVDFDDVVVVAAREAHQEYLDQAAYVCQPNRAFREGLTHMGFYAFGQIKIEVPRIRYREEGIIFSRAEAARRRRRGDERERRIATLIETLLEDGSRHHGQAYQVFLLSAADDPDTVKLARPIDNDSRTAAGRPWAWTLGQRYVRLSRLTAPGVKVTSDLED